MSPFKKTVAILHSLLSIVFLSFLLDSAILVSFFPAIFVDSLIGKVLFFTLIPIRVVLCAGIYGMLVEIASGEQRVVTSKSFKKNARQFWPIFGVIAAVPYMIDLFFMLSLGPVRIPHLLTTALVQLSLFYVLSSEIIKKKYRYLLSPRQSPRLSQAAVGQIFVLFFSGLIISSLSLYLNGLVLEGAILLMKYLMFFEFIFLSILILEQNPKITNHFNFEKELILISPAPAGVVMDIAYTLMNRLYPALFLVLRALTPATYKIREYNMVVWRDRYFDAGKLVAITCFTTNSAEAYKIAKEFRRQGSTVVMGGSHVSFLPDEALEFCDCVVIGEVEGVWDTIIHDYEMGTLQKKYYGEPLADYYSRVQTELLNTPPDMLKDCLQIFRGCKYRCHFCTIPALTSRTIRQKPIPYIISAIEKIKTRFNTFGFLDSNFYADPAYAQELFRALAPLKVNWSGLCSIDIAQDDEVLRSLKDSGCRAVLIGYEISGNSLEQQRGGKFAIAKRYLELTRKIKKLNISIKAHFILGFESDDFESLGELWKFCLKLNPFMTGISLLTPFPGSMIYYQMLKEDRLLNLNWRNFSMLGLVFKPQKINRRVLEACFPFIYGFFLATTCTFGRVFMGISILAYLIYYFLSTNFYI